MVRSHSNSMKCQIQQQYCAIVTICILVGVPLPTLIQFPQHSFRYLRFLAHLFADRTTHPKITATMSGDTSKMAKNQEKIIAEFQQLRNEQRNLVNNISKLEVDLKEHKCVL